MAEPRGGSRAPPGCQQTFQRGWKSLWVNGTPSLWLAADGDWRFLPHRLHGRQRGRHRGVGRRRDLCHVLRCPRSRPKVSADHHWALHLPQPQSCLVSSGGMVCSLPVVGYFVFRAALRVIEKDTAAYTRQKSPPIRSVVPLCSAATSSHPSRPRQEQQPHISALRLHWLVFFPESLFIITRMQQEEKPLAFAGSMLLNGIDIHFQDMFVSCIDLAPTAPFFARIFQLRGPLRHLWVKMSVRQIILMRL